MLILLLIPSLLLIAYLFYLYLDYTNKQIVAYLYCLYLDCANKQIDDVLQSEFDDWEDYK